MIQGNISTPDLGGGTWDGWYGPTGRSESESVHDLIPLIINSMAGQALYTSGFHINESRLDMMQRKAEVLCNPTMEQRQVICDPYNAPCLFNLEADPCEQRNVADNYPDVVRKLLNLLAEQNATALPPIPRVQDPNADPAKWGNVWTTWLDNIDDGRNPDFPNICGIGSGTVNLLGNFQKIFIILSGISVVYV